MRSAKPGIVLAAAVVVLGCSARDIPQSSVEDCARCHEFPPATAAHAQLVAPTPAECSACHGTSVAADGSIISGGTHADGHVDAGHPAGYANPAVHGPVADASILQCAQCHGADYDGNASLGAPSCNACHGLDGFASWRTNCTFCHGSRTAGYTGVDPKAAPPEGVHGETLRSEGPVGAHQQHLVPTISKGVACGDCHTVPAGLGHLDGSAAVTFSAAAGGQAARYSGGACSSVSCHAALQGGSTPAPSWTAASLPCDGCHGLPPATGKLASNGETLHVFHAVTQQRLCWYCHATVLQHTATPAISAANRALHVDGNKDVSLSAGGTYDTASKTCSNVVCHGNETWQ